MKKIKMAILGLGRSGWALHGRLTLHLKDKFEIVAGIDPLEDRRQRAIEEFGCDVYSDYKEILGRKDIDLVVNTAPSNLHHTISNDLMDHGFHVLCEKPAADSPEAIDTMIESSKKNKRMLAIYHNLGHMPHVLKIREVLSSGVLGRIIQVDANLSLFTRRWDWQTMLKHSGGNVYNRGSHVIDQLIHMLDIKKMPSVYGFMDKVNSFGDADDYTKIILKGDDLPIMDIELTSCQAYPDYKYKIQGSKGGLVCRDEEIIEWKYFKPEEAPEQKLITEPLVNENGEPAYCRETLKWYEEKWEVPKELRNNFKAAHIRLYNNIYDVLVNGAELINTPEKSKLQLMIIEECKNQNPRFIYRG